MEFAAQYPAEFLDWHTKSNSIIVLAAQNERKLIEFSLKLRELSVNFSEFREPDIGNELTAIAICPGSEVRRICSGLPLAGKRANEGAVERLTRKFEVVEAMQTCEQRSGQTIWQHGELVQTRMKDLVSFLQDPHYTPKFAWRFPQWVLRHSKELLENLQPSHVFEKYTLWHDCGKPFCKVQDSDGKIRFPGHATVSSSVFREIYPEQEDVAKLIEMDMDIHLLTSDGINEFASRLEATTLLLVGLAEIHANAELFGGITTDSFKIKWKQLDRKGAAICKILFC